MSIEQNSLIYANTEYPRCFVQKRAHKAHGGILYIITLCEGHKGLRFTLKHLANVKLDLFKAFDYIDFLCHNKKMLINIHFNHQHIPFIAV